MDDDCGAFRKKNKHVREIMVVKLLGHIFLKVYFDPTTYYMVIWSGSLGRGEGPLPDEQSNKSSVL